MHDLTHTLPTVIPAHTLYMNPAWQSILAAARAGHRDTQTDAARETLPAPGLTALTARSVLQVSGPDASAFLHAQFISDIAAMPPGAATLSAWCNPKGRSVCNFVVAYDGDAYTLVLPRALHETFRQRLQMFVLRAQVSIADRLDELLCAGLLYDDHPAPEDGVPPVGDRHCQRHEGGLAIGYLPGCRLLVGDADYTRKLWADATAMPVYPAAQWAWTEIRQRCPWLEADAGELFIPQEMSLDEFGVMSYDKGCYPGQEIIARLRYRGEVKRRLYTASCDAAAPVPPAAKIVAGKGDKAGAVVAAVRTDKTQRLLCVIDKRRAQEGKLRIAEMDGAELILENPPPQ